jgi:peptidyl-prolyl cis-trans isomerase SurA
MQVKQACAGAFLLALGVGALAILPANAQQGASPAKASAAKPGKAKPSPAKAAAIAKSAGVAAVVNDEVVSTFDVAQRSALILASSGIQPTDDAMKQVRGQALRALVDEHLQTQEAREKKIKLETKDVDTAIERIAQSNNLTVAQFTSQLNNAGTSMAALRTQIGSEILWRRLVNGRYGSRVRISNVEVQDTLARIQANASRPQYNMAEILLAADTDQEFKDAETAAGRLLQELRGGRVSFTAIARQFSAAPTAAAGGDLGWMSEGELRPELALAAKALKPGQVSQPIRTAQGILIVALREAKDGIDPRTAMHVKLQQITAPASSRAALDRARSRVRGCDSIAAAMKNVPGAQVVDLGDTAEADLAEATRTKVAETSAGQTTSLMDTADGVSTIAVCGRGSQGGVVPSRDEIEDRLYDQEIALLSQRYLMDLRRDSTIITR